MKFFMNKHDVSRGRTTRTPCIFIPLLFFSDGPTSPPCWEFQEGLTRCADVISLSTQTKTIVCDAGFEIYSAQLSSGEVVFICVLHANTCATTTPPTHTTNCFCQLHSYFFLCFHLHGCITKIESPICLLTPCTPLDSPLPLLAPPYCLPYTVGYFGETVLISL